MKLLWLRCFSSFLVILVSPIKNTFLNNKIRSRVDRCYLKDIPPKNYLLEKDIIMSDHYALLIEI